MNELDEIFSYYEGQPDKGTQEMVVALLRELQDVEGFISSTLKRRVIEATGITETFLNCIIRMYPSIQECKPKHVILACTGERCASKNSAEILRQIRKEIGVEKTGVSKDGTFELRTQNCLKKCKTAPNVLIDDVLYSGKQLQDIHRLIQTIRKNQK